MTDKPIVPNEWTDLFVALADFATACGGSFHCSDPVKAEAMARVLNATADMLRWNEEAAFGVEQDGRAFAADIVTSARKPLGRYTVTDTAGALAMLHHVASEGRGVDMLVIASQRGVDHVISSAPCGQRPSFTPASPRLTWPNGAVARVFGPGQVERVRGIGARFCLVTEWPSQEDWHHVEIAVRMGAAQIVMLSEPPYPIGSDVKPPPYRWVPVGDPATRAAHSASYPEPSTRWSIDEAGRPLTPNRDITKAMRDAQDEADRVGSPVSVRITIGADARVIGHHRAWVYPLATFDQWMIERATDGSERPVFIGPSEGS
jgi:hypothetical protein